jgi:hypothetical protein
VAHNAVDACVDDGVPALLLMAHHQGGEGVGAQGQRDDSPSRREQQETASRHNCVWLGDQAKAKPIESTESD